MGSPNVWKNRQGVAPRPFRARIGGLLFAQAVVLAAIWLLARAQ
jgi:hypothetical protein